MTIDQMREWLKIAYHNDPSWSRKVDQMRGNQVIAIYRRLESEGRFEEKKKEPRVVQLKMDI